MLEQLTRQLAAAESLSEPQIKTAVEILVGESSTVIEKAEFLTALARKGETVEEIVCFARELRALAIEPLLDSDLRNHEILDVVGTGGDGVRSFNISTTVALLAAAAGVRVAKHGNRASTSPTGSADVLQALGIPHDLGPEEAARSLRRHGFAFFFAPKYHPAFRNIIPARKVCAERGQRTLFNFLGPLLNPARPSAALVGVPKPALCEPFAHVLQTLGVRRAMVVCGRVLPATEAGQSLASEVFLDEISSLGPSTIAEFYQERGFTCSTFAPDSFPLQAAVLDDLRGGSPEVSARIVRDLFDGKDLGPKRDVVLLNAAAALFVAGRTRSLLEGWQVAANVIDSGQAKRKLDELAAK